MGEYQEFDRWIALGAFCIGLVLALLAGTALVAVARRLFKDNIATSIGYVVLTAVTALIALVFYGMALESAALSGVPFLDALSSLERARLAIALLVLTLLSAVFVALRSKKQSAPPRNRRRQ